MSKTVKGILSKYISYEPIEHVDNYDSDQIDKKTNELIDQALKEMREVVNTLKTHRDPSIHAELLFKDDVLKVLGGGG